MGKYSFGPMTAELYTNHRVSRYKWDAVEDLARRYSEQIVKENNLTHGEAMALLDRCKVTLSATANLNGSYITTVQPKSDSESESLGLR